MIFALDPLFLGDAGTLEVVLIVILKVLVAFGVLLLTVMLYICLLYTSPSPRDGLLSRMPSSA